jgi:hypothetical protein
MVQLVAHDEVCLPDQLWDQARIGSEARLVDQRGVSPFEGGQPSLQRDVKVHRSGNRPDRA